jgi:DDE superfamily endonuclease
MAKRTTELGFIHQFIPSSDKKRNLITLILLHGTGRNEQDLIPLGGVIAPGAAMLSPRGKVIENGMPRFFRRLAEGVFDIEDLKFRTHELADFIDHLTNVKRYLKRNRVKRFILVIDNVSFHISRKTKYFLNKQAQWLTVIYLPKRSPNLNPVETKVNRNLKKDIFANHNYQSGENLIVAVTRYLKSIGSWRRL